MRLSRPRLTLRRLMIAIAIVAVGLAGTKLYRLRVRYSRDAAGFAAEVTKLEGYEVKIRGDLARDQEGDVAASAKHADFRAAMNRHRMTLWRLGGSVDWENTDNDRMEEERRASRQVSEQMDLDWLANLGRELAFQRAMRDRYRHAADHPWLPLPPEPPNPR